MNKIEDILESFNFLESWEDKYQHLIDMGRQLEPLDENLKNEKNRLYGCQSTVYFVTKENKDGTLVFLAESDAFIVQGLIALLLNIYSNIHPKEILKIDTSFLEKIGLQSHLSPTRKNGLYSMINKINFEAKSRLGKK